MGYLCCSQRLPSLDELGQDPSPPLLTQFLLVVEICPCLAILRQRAPWSFKMGSVIVSGCGHILITVILQLEKEIVQNPAHGDDLAADIRVILQEPASLVQAPKPSLPTADLALDFRPELLKRPVEGPLVVIGRVVVLGEEDGLQRVSWGDIL